MVVGDDFKVNNSIHFGPEELKQLLLRIKSNKENQIVNIKDKIIKYEEKRRTEEVVYQALPLIKKMFTSRAPSHHQAVEYMVYVKDRFKSIEKIKRDITRLDELILLIQSKPGNEEIQLSGLLLEEIKSLEGSGGRLSDN
ncbi:hypothetical protein [Bacillus marasmi]|uniref:hypothetical protein n=1 Tax=Bacillus marasmi TaxID=1926279 RepID=UPI0011CC6DE0|nr:hypothetical protein [Bacillus marasmi]